MPHVPGHVETEEERIRRERSEAGLTGPIPESLRRLIDVRRAQPTSTPHPTPTRPAPTPPRPPTPTPAPPAPLAPIDDPRKVRELQQRLAQVEEGRPDIAAFNEEQRRTLERQQRFAETSPDVVGQRILDPIGRFRRTSQGALLQAAARSGAAKPLPPEAPPSVPVERQPGLPIERPEIEAFNEEQRQALERQRQFAETSRDVVGQPIEQLRAALAEFEQNVAVAREQGAGRLESLRLGREAAEQQAVQFPSVSLKIPGARGPTIQAGVLGLVDFLADPTLPVPIIGIGPGGLLKGGLRGVSREIAETPLASIGRSRFPRGPLTAPTREAVREAPEAAARAVPERMPTTGQQAVADFDKAVARAEILNVIKVRRDLARESRKVADAFPEDAPEILKRAKAEESFASALERNLDEAVLQRLEGKATIKPHEMAADAAARAARAAPTVREAAREAPEAAARAVPAVRETRLPQAVPGTPEAGVQRGMLGVPDQAVTPRGAPAQQVSLDDQLRLVSRETEARVESASRLVSDLTAEVEARELSGIVRPRWAAGVTNEELAAVARQEGLNPTVPDWADAIDPVVIREAKQGFFRNPNAETLTSIRARRTQARAELKADQRALAKNPHIAASKVDDVTERIEADVARTRVLAEAAGQSPPPRAPGIPEGISGDLPPPRRPDVGLADDLQLPTHEVPQSGIMRKWEGARAAEGLAMEEWFSGGNALAKRLGFREFTEDTMRPVYEALHGERAVGTLSDAQNQLYDFARRMQFIEEEDMLAFLGQVQDEGSRTLMAFDAENLAGRFMAHPDYFPRGWKPPKSLAAQAGTSRGRLGATPSLAKPRVDATFSALLDFGLEPASWNPFAMMAMRRMAGVEYRESVKLANRLFQRGLALPRQEAPAGWRVPKVGPVFEGRPILADDGTGAITFTQPIAVPNNVADFVESAFGVPSNIPGLQAIRQWSTRAKRLKLAASHFQHIDFVGRAAGVALSPTGIRSGAPLKFPSMAKTLLNVYWSSGARNTLRRRILSDAPIYKDFNISYKMLVEEGWGVQGDLSLIRREFGDLVARATKATVDGRSVPAEVLARSTGAIKKAQEFFEGGLFDGFYREVQRYSLETFIIPWIRRTRPTATARQVAAEAAETVNTMFSTLGLWQTVLKNPDLKDFSQILIFSTNESEGLIKGALQAMSVPGAGRVRGALTGKAATASKFVPKASQAGLFREWYLGLFLSMAAMANGINFMATGKPLPAEAYRPINIDDPYAPFGVAYNSRFLSPQIPFIRGRNDQPIYLDIVGQMDTAFRWALDPVSAVASRVNVLPRAIMNQSKGSGFFGNQLDTPAKRVSQAVSDVAMPIGPGSVAGAFREQIPGGETLFPEAESRLGMAGQLLQATGPNIRSEQTGQLLDRAANEVRPGVAYRDLEPWEKDIVQDRQAVELEARTQTSIERQNEGSKFFGTLNSLDQQWEESLQTLASNIGKRLGGQMIDQRFVQNQYFELEAALRNQKEGAQAALGREFAETEPRNQGEVDIRAYFALSDQAVIQGQFITKELTRLRTQFMSKLPETRRAYVLRNINRRAELIPNKVLKLLPDVTRMRIQTSLQAREAARKRLGLR